MTHIGQGQHHHHIAHGGNREVRSNALMEGMAQQIATGILAEFSNVLGAGPLAFAQFPGAFDVRCGIVPGGCYRPGCGDIICPEPKAQWTASLDSASTAKINLGDGYRLEIDERSSQITIINDNTGERTRIWGDPHVEIDGKHAFDFWGTTTFTLENGTKITVNTEQWQGNPNAYVASQVVITKGDNAIIVDGISQNKIGDLSVSMSNNGYAIDNAVRDGFTLNENSSGSGWRTEMGNIATQADLNATAVGGEYGPGSEKISLSEISQDLGSFLILGIFAMFLQWFNGADGPKCGAPTGSDTRPVMRPVDDIILVGRPVPVAETPTMRPIEEIVFVGRPVPAPQEQEIVPERGGGRFGGGRGFDGGRTQLV